MELRWSCKGLVEKWQAISNWEIILYGKNGNKNGRHPLDDRRLAKIKALDDRQLADILMFTQL